jgi:hypothetical protein
LHAVREPFPHNTRTFYGRLAAASSSLPRRRAPHPGAAAGGSPGRRLGEGGSGRMYADSVVIHS